MIAERGFANAGPNRSGNSDCAELSRFDGYSAFSGLADFSPAAMRLEAGGN